MKGFILAGGEGTRLRPLTLACPKPVVPVANRPFLEYQLEMLAPVASDGTILSLSYLPGHIRAVMGNGDRFATRLEYAIEPQPLGTAGAIGYSREALGGGAFVVLNGDVLCDIRLEDVLAFHRRHGGIGTLVLVRVEDPSRYGLVLFDGGHAITAFEEKPAPGTARGNTINAGIYILEPEALAHIPAGGKYSVERGLFPALLERGLSLYAYIFEGYWIDIGTTEKYRQVHADILERRFVTPALARARYDEPPAAGAGAAFEPPFLVDPSAHLGSGVRIGKGSVVGPGCVIGDKAELTDCILWDGVRVGDGSRLAHVVVSSALAIGKHAIVDGPAFLGPGSQIGDYTRVGC